MLEKTIAVGLILPDLPRTVAEEHLDELAQLIQSAGGEVAGRVFAKRNAPDAATYVGRGKAEEIGELAAAEGAALIVFDDDLTAAQVRNLEKIIPARVIDRSALILDIFAGRARSREARTQVELAQLEYMLPRLTRAWSHLSRQAGGAGGGAKRGVGETQLELDRRATRTRIARLKDELRKIEQTRLTQRKSREGAFVVALVGYTNAGKSTLFNRLTRGGAEAADKLFATLDAKSHRAEGDFPIDTVVIDTVGFIRKLPHHLVASFRSTMEEAVAADLVLHVIDASHPQHEEQREIGQEVLSDLGVDREKVLEVYNKVDRLDAQPAARALNVSALTGAGIDRLLQAVRDRQLEEGEVMEIEIPHDEPRLMAQLHERTQVRSQRQNGTATIFVAWVPRDAVHFFQSHSTANLLKSVQAG